MLFIKNIKTSRLLPSLLFIFVLLSSFLFLISIGKDKLILSANANSKLSSDILSEKEKLVVLTEKSVGKINEADSLKPIIISEDDISNVKNIEKYIIGENGKSYLETTPNDTYYSNTSTSYALPGQLLDSWNLRDINLLPTDEVPASAWKTTTGSSNTIVAVIDTGIDTTHSDLSANLWVNPGEIAGNGIDDDGNGYIDDVNGFNFADSFDANGNGTYTNIGDTNNANVTDSDGHGTHVAGVIAGRSNNSLGVAGICWTCKVMALKVVSALTGFAYDSDVALAIHYAAVMGAKVINVSLGGGGTSIIIDNSIEEAFKTYHAIVIGASGNDYIDSSDSYPGAATYVVNVGASYVTNVNDPLSSFSNHGNRMDILAPGGQSNQGATQKEAIVSTYKSNQYALMKGTSMASPHVAGVAALLSDYHRLDVSPWGAKEIRYALLSSATDITNTGAGYAVGFDSKSGYGKLNALSSVAVPNSSVSFLATDVTYPVATINALSDVKAHGTISINGTVSDTNIYIYTLYFLRASDSSVILQRSARGNVNNSTVLSFDTTQLTDGDYYVGI
ncbi:MAG: S8 family peptidase, partial [bacterium]